MIEDDIQFHAAQFHPWPRIPRLNRDIVITEKIDGTNAAIRIDDDGFFRFAQSRSRVITPEDDNFGFARWAHESGVKLAEILGPGLHFGEWWGAGIQRKYGLTTQAFSLFNAPRWRDLDANVWGIPVQAVPILYEGPWFTVNNEWAPNAALRDLKAGGSAAAKFDKPEGIVVWHQASGVSFKVTIERDDKPKGEA